MGQHKIAPGNAKDLLAPAKFDVEFQPPPPPSSSSIFFGALRPRPGPPAAAFDLPPSRFDPRDNFGFPVFGPMAQVQFRPLRPVDAFDFPFRPPDEGLESFPFAVRPNFFFEKPGPIVIRPKAPNGLEAPDNREEFSSGGLERFQFPSNFLDKFGPVVAVANNHEEPKFDGPDRFRVPMNPSFPSRLPGPAKEGGFVFTSCP